MTRLVSGYDAEAEEGPIVGRDTFGEPVRQHDRSVIVGRDSMGEPVTAKERHDNWIADNDSLVRRDRR